VVPILSSATDVVVADLRGFGESDKHPAEPTEQYTAAAQARSIVGLIEQLGLDRPVIGGYDIGSRIAQTIAGDEAVAAAREHVAKSGATFVHAFDDPRVIAGQGTLGLELAEQLVEGRPDAVRAYLRHFWSHWSGPGFELTDTHLEHLVSVYAGEGAFTASIGWYRAGAGAVARSVTEQGPGGWGPHRRAHHSVVART